MDALEYLQNDHARLTSLLDQFRDSSGQQSQQSLLQGIRSGLETHALVKEQVFYPAFKNYPELSEAIERAAVEQKDIRDRLQRLASIQAPEELKTQVNELRERVTRHVQSEQEQLFPLVRKIMRRPERERLGRHMEALRHENLNIAA